MIKALMTVKLSRAFYQGGAGIDEVTAYDLNRDMVAVEEDFFQASSRKEYFPHIRLKFPVPADRSEQTETLTALGVGATMVGCRVNQNVYMPRNNAILPEDRELDPGAFVAVNDDDDDSGFNATTTRITAANGHNARNLRLHGRLTTPDSADGNGVLNTDGESVEDDMLHLRVEPFALADVDGRLVLEYPAHLVRVWRTPGKRPGTMIASGSALLRAHTVNDLFVEAISKSAEQRDVLVRVAYRANGLDNRDDVAFTNYALVGPVDVPDRSLYTYTLEIPRDDGNWDRRADHSYRVRRSGRSVEIGWDRGPGIGRIRALPHPDFPQDRLVNIVGVTVAGGVFARGTLQVGAGGCNSIAPFDWRADVALNGPNRAGHANAGVHKIQLGFVQLIRTSHATARYVGGGNDARVTYHCAGVWRVDSDIRHTENNVYYYDATAPFGVWNQIAEAAAPHAAIAATLRATDSPNFPLIRSVETPVGNAIDMSSFRVRDEFQLFVAARTLHEGGGAWTRYIPRARRDWDWDGNAYVDNLGNWRHRRPLPGHNNQAFFGVQGGRWRAVTSGQPVQLTTFGNRCWNEIANGGLRGFWMQDRRRGRNFRIATGPRLTYGRRGHAYDQLLVASGGTRGAGYQNWRLTIAPAAAWLGAAVHTPTTGRLHGAVPAAPAASNQCHTAWVDVDDRAGPPNRRTFRAWELCIVDADPNVPLRLANHAGAGRTSASKLPWARRGTPFDFSLLQEGGITGYRWNAPSEPHARLFERRIRIIGGGLPAGLNWANGRIHGVPTQSGLFDLSVELVDEERVQRNSAVKKFVLVVEEP